MECMKVYDKYYQVFTYFMLLYFPLYVILDNVDALCIIYLSYISYIFSAR